MEGTQNELFPKKFNWKKPIQNALANNINDVVCEVDLYFYKPGWDDHWINQVVATLQGTFFTRFVIFQKMTHAIFFQGRFLTSSSFLKHIQSRNKNSLLQNKQKSDCLAPLSIRMGLFFLNLKNIREKDMFR